MCIMDDKYYLALDCDSCDSINVFQTGLDIDNMLVSYWGNGQVLLHNLGLTIEDVEKKKEIVLIKQWNFV